MSEYNTIQELRYQLARLNSELFGSWRNVSHLQKKLNRAKEWMKNYQRCNQELKCQLKADRAYIKALKETVQACSALKLPQWSEGRWKQWHELENHHE